MSIAGSGRVRSLRSLRHPLYSPSGNGDDLKKKEIADILLSDATIQDQNIQSIRFKPAYQRMFEAPKNLAFCNWSTLWNDVRTEIVKIQNQ
jgi:hypothetical protein